MHAARARSRPSRSAPAANRVAAIVPGLLVLLASLLVSGCANQPEVDPIFRVVPGQHTNCGMQDLPATPGCERAYPDPGRQPVAY